MTAGRIVLGLDQARSTGWGIAPERGRVVRHGLARTVDDRLEVMRILLELAGDDPRRIWVWFEQHDHMPSGRLGVHDHETARRRGTNKYAPQTSNKTLIGMGKPYGRWEEQLAIIRVPDAHIDEVRPTTWRAAIHGVQRADRVKQAAKDWASREAGEPIDNDDHAEGYCITSWAAIHGLARYDQAKAKARIEALAKRSATKQTSLFDMSPPESAAERRS